MPERRPAYLWPPTVQHRTTTAGSRQTAERDRQAPHTSHRLDCRQPSRRRSRGSGLE